MGKDICQISSVSLQNTQRTRVFLFSTKYIMIQPFGNCHMTDLWSIPAHEIANSGIEGAILRTQILFTCQIPQSKRNSKLLTFEEHMMLEESGVVHKILEYF